MPRTAKLNLFRLKCCKTLYSHVFFEKYKISEIGYFRKVNFLVKFFEDKGFDVENQTPYKIKIEDIIDLINRCETVLKNHELADKLLPTMSGFFFGSTDYDEDYYDDVKQVFEYCKNNLLPIFNELEEDEYLTFETWY